MTLKLGFNSCSNESYHKDTEYLSSSSLKLMLENPKKFHAQYILKEEAEYKQSDALDFGSYIHTLILEPELLDKEYVVYPGVKRGKAWEEFKTQHKDKIIVSNTQALKARELEAEFKKDEDAIDLIKHGLAEQTLCVELDGVKIKVRADYVQGTSIIDLKTTGYGTGLEAVQGSCIKWNYPLSAALYVDAFSKHYDKQFDFYFIFINKKEPITVQCFKAGDDFLEYGRKQYKEAIKLIKEAKRSGKWYEEETGIPVLGLPTGIG